MIPKTRHYRAVERRKQELPFDEEHCYITLDFYALSLIALAATLLGMVVSLALFNRH